MALRAVLSRVKQFFQTAPAVAGPLSQIRVIELCADSTICGPLAGRLLADQGAECVKVEPCEGDRLRLSRVVVGKGRDISPDFHMVNRGKLSLALDMNSEA